MKNYVVLDWYKSFTEPTLVGFFDTIEETEKAIAEWVVETDNECDCVSYPTNMERYKKIVEIAKRLEEEND